MFTHKTRRATNFLMIGVAVSLLTNGMAVPAAMAQNEKKFTFILDFLPYGEFAPFYLALAKGWYKEEGLDVEILRGAGGGDTVKRIAAGQGDAGIADFGTVLAGIANEDAKVKIIAPVYREMPNSVFVRDGTGINSVKDLVGKSVGTTPGNSHFVLWPMVAQSAGIPVDSVKWVTMDGASMGPALIAGRIDAAPFASWHETRLQIQGAQQGVRLKRMLYSDYGVDSYSLSIFARDDSIEKNADALKAFLRASIRGIRYVCQEDHAREGAEAVVKYNPVVDLESAAGATAIACRLAINKDIVSGQYAIGQSDPARVERIRDMYVKYLNLKRSPSAGEIVTNTLLPASK